MSKGRGASVMPEPPWVVWCNGSEEPVGLVDVRIRIGATYHTCIARNLNWDMRGEWNDVMEWRPAVALKEYQRPNQ